MKRIIIIGCPGSGKSTLARALGEKLNLTVVHLDRLWWTKDQQHTSREEFDARLENALKLERWIIDGNYSRTMDARLQHCDTIIYLVYCHSCFTSLQWFRRFYFKYLDHDIIILVYQIYFKIVSWLKYCHLYLNN